MATNKERARFYGFLLASAVALATPASAALFGDSELARQTQALRQRVEALDARLAKLEAAMQQNSKLLDMQQEVERLKTEVARLRGQAEVQVHQLDTLTKRQSDLYADLDQRVGELAKAAAGAAGPGGAAEGAAPDAVPESRAYEAALGQFRQAKYEDAIASFKGFLKTYPASTLAANAQYWIGYAYYALKDYKAALAQQQKLVAAYPASPKVPDALLNMATSQIALDDMAGARKTLEEIVAKHPGTNAAALAERRLAVLK
ncbi:MAG: tol-pal system protein YbgF [Thiobacillus sp.]